MRYRHVDRVVVTLGVVAAMGFLLAAGGGQSALADNVIPNPRELSMDAGTTSNQLTIKIVSNTAQSQSGDPQPKCNTNDDSPAIITFLISPSQGLTADPLTINKCNQPFPVTLTAVTAGVYTITASVEDNGAAGGVYHLEPFGQVIVTVINADVTPPVISVDPQTPTAEATSSAGAAVEFTVTATDDFDGNVAATCDAQSGQVFAIGTTAVSCTATDAASNTGTLGFNVVVQDTTAPTISLSNPGPLSAEATGTLTSVDLGTASASDLVDGTLPVTSDAPAAGFLLGNNVVTYTATDAAGNTATLTQQVTIQDTAAPVIGNVPADIFQEADAGANTAVVTYASPTATDNHDGAVAVNCTPASGSAFPIGENTVNCSATDSAGNSANASFKVIIQKITITSVNPPNAEWGTTVTVVGTVGGALAGNTVEVDLSDGPAVSGIPISGGSWSIDHEFSTTGTKTITARLMDESAIRATSVSQVIIEKRDTTLQVISPQEDLFLTSNTKMLVGVNLVDASGSGVEGAVIEFTGLNSENAVTQGVTFSGDLTLNSCPDPTCFQDGIGIDPDGPDEDGIFPPDADNKVLDVKVGTEIIFPVTTTAAFVYIQNYAEPIEYRVFEYGVGQKDCHADPGVQDCILPMPDPGEGGVIAPPSGSSIVNGVTVYNGIEKIIITKVGTNDVDATVRITAVLTKNDDSVPADQHVINFENEDVGDKPSPYTLNGGVAFAYHITQDTEGDDLEFQAEFTGNNLYNPSSAMGTFNIQNDGDSLEGVGGVGESSVDSGTGTAFSARSCTGSCDSDFDAIPNVEETARLVDDNIIAPGESYPITLEAGDANDVFPSTTKPDVYFEIDCMADVTCLTNAQADYIESRFSLRGIQMHIDIDETNVCGNVGGLVTPVNPVIAWNDGQAENTADGLETAAECNDYTSIKLNHFGTEAERGDTDGSGVNLGSTLGSGGGDMKLKHLFTRYLLFTYNTNNAGNTNCGTSGVAEFIGNDAIVSVQCLIDQATNPVGVPQIILGTTMHEIGHPLGLKHGGTDDINCKCNYISVMNYIRQMPNEEMAVMTDGQTGTGSGGPYQWWGDYSHGPLLYKNSAGANIGDGKTINEASLTDNNRLVITGGSLWKEANGVKVSSLATVTKFKILWSDTTPGAADPIKDGYAATAFASSSVINWNGIGGLTAGQDTNYLTVEVGGDQLPACTQALEQTNLLSPVDDYATMKSKLDEAMNQNTDLLGLGQSGFQDPDNLPEMNLETYETLSGVIFQSPGVEPPLNNVGFGDPGMAQMKKGSTVNVKLDIFDEEGNEVTSSNVLSVYGIQRINLKLALVNSTSMAPPDDSAYFSPQTSTQNRSSDFFEESGSKWTFSFGTKNLQQNGVYAARIQLVFTSGEIYVLDNKNDTVDNISFNLKIVKG